MRKFEIIEGTSIFSPDLVATMRHPLVKAASSDAHAKILTQKLYSYLYFTEKLERRTVMPACIHLAEGTAPFDSPSALKRDASKILVDEAHHAECAAELIAQVAASTGEAPRLGYRPSFLTALADAAARANRAGQPFVDLTFVAVSETLITGTLARVPLDPHVNPYVRDVVKDHAQDEARHYACFSDVIHIMWSQLSTRERDAVGPLFAEFIEAFLAPDLAAEVRWLQAAGFDGATARSIVHETFENMSRAQLFREQARPTLTKLRSFGMLDHAPTLDALAERDLL